MSTERAVVALHDGGIVEVSMHEIVGVFVWYKLQDRRQRYTRAESDCPIWIHGWLSVDLVGDRRLA